MPFLKRTFTKLSCARVKKLDKLIQTFLQVILPIKKLKCKQNYLLKANGLQAFLSLPFSIFWEFLANSAKSLFLFHLTDQKNMSIRLIHNLELSILTKKWPKIFMFASVSQFIA